MVTGMVPILLRGTSRRPRDHHVEHTHGIAASQAANDARALATYYSIVFAWSSQADSVPWTLSFGSQSEEEEEEGREELAFTAVELAAHSLLGDK